ncbi:hypothetical protein [Amycolatopsis nigrescens]|uniref:hypothetical protein n=1 Tax=Amycolatopsis nigrescens TaxID=381445 RepID=UPI00035DCB2C|nr:hypothetical protein [Amycolatopsis nigrescens]
MKLLRLLLVLPGLAALGWGVLLLIEFGLPLGPHSFVAAGWLLAGPLLHDGLVAPLTGLAGVGLSRILPAAWQAPVAGGAVVTGVLGLLALPLLWRSYGAPPLPGLHDGNTWLGLLLSVGVVWLVVLIAGVTRQHAAS